VNVPLKKTKDGCVRLWEILKSFSLENACSLLLYYYGCETLKYCVCGRFVYSRLLPQTVMQPALFIIV